ncbi:MAG: hypothetical protein U5Q16_01345 [Gammaproteobacteria bacterium]|nr:hypothetical protein [Gammaproteobacteria bacterium]
MSTGGDFFTYTLTDDEQDETSTATVTVTSTPVNDPPVGTSLLTYEVMENGELDVDVPNGLLASAYDVDGALLGPDGEPVGAELSVEIEDGVDDGTLSLNTLTGAFE